MNGFVMVPGWLIAKRPDGNDVLVYISLASFGSFDTLNGVYEECRPALATITEMTGLSVSSVKRAIANLLRFGAITRTQRHAEDGRTQLPSVYRVMFGVICGPGGSICEPGAPSTGEPGGSPPVSQDQEPDTKNQDTKKPSASPRGTRMNPDWYPDEDLVAWCLRELVPGGRWNEHSRDFVRRETFKFIDYWIAAPGRNGLKLDWAATWRNWMRRAFERYDAVRPVSGPPAKPFVQQADEYRAKRAEGEKLHSAVAQQLIDDGMPVTEAMKRADEARRAYMARDPMETNAGVPYIEGVILGEDQPKEVTGS